MQTRHVILRTALIFFAAAVETTPAQSVLPVQGEVVAAHGLPVPGLQGAAFNGTAAFDLPVIDEQGRISFRARFSGAGVSAMDDRAVFVGTSKDDLQIAARGGSSAATLSAITMSSGTSQGLGGGVRMGPGGDVLFGSALAGPGVTVFNDSAWLVWTPLALTIAVREGDAAPGTAGAALSSTFGTVFPSTTALSRFGRVAFSSDTLGGDTTVSNNMGMFGGLPGSLELIQRKGSAVIGDAIVTALGTVCQTNDLGEVLHDATIGQAGSTPVTPADDKTLWLFNPGVGDTLVIREGDPAIGTTGALFGNPSTTWNCNVGPNALNRNGQLAVLVDLVAGDTVAGVNDQGIFVGNLFGVSLACRKGSALPGTSATLASISTAGGVSLNGSGDLLFQAALTGSGVTASNDTAIWVGPPGSLALVAREGSPAPGTIGASLGSLSGAQMHLNDRHQVVFTATLVGGDVTGPSNSSALYSYDPVSGVTLLLRGADAVTVCPGVVKSVSSFSTVQQNNGDGASLAFNHAGDLVLRANMTDGTAAIVRGHIGQLVATPLYLSATTGGTQQLFLNGGIAHGGETFLIGGSASGTTPGFPVGLFTIPLNIDDYFSITLSLANTQIFVDTLGMLSPAGTATASINLPPGVGQLTGLVLHHCFGSVGATGLALVSEPTKLVIAP